MATTSYYTFCDGSTATLVSGNSGVKLTEGLAVLSQAINANIEVRGGSSGLLDPELTLRKTSEGKYLASYTGNGDVTFYYDGVYAPTGESSPSPTKTVIALLESDGTYAADWAVYNV